MKSVLAAELAEFLEFKPVRSVLFVFLCTAAISLRLFLSVSSSLHLQKHQRSPDDSFYKAVTDVHAVLRAVRHVVTVRQVFLHGEARQKSPADRGKNIIPSWRASVKSFLIFFIFFFVKGQFFS